jgi:arylsulfatase A-like enzyme
MITRKTLPALSLFLLAACASNAGGDPSRETTSTQALAEGVGDDDLDVRHVLLVSVDGLHETDLARWIAGHPASTLAALAESGVHYSDAHTTTPSDSFPGLLALVTGGTPRTTGVYYDDSYDRTLYAPGSGCQGAPGTEVVLDESVEHDDSQLFSPIDPGNLPLHKDHAGRCVPVYPHDFIRVNTVFEVVRAAGGHTAWSDKHPAYDLVNGPSGAGVEDLYTPEVNSLIKNGGNANGVDLAATLRLCDGTTNSLPLAKVSDYTTCEPAIMAYDDVKVQAVVNEIDGRTSDGSRAARVPAVFGMNFQQVSVAEKLPVGGYADAEGTPSALLGAAIAHVDASLGRMVSELRAHHLLERTLIVVSAKHGQSPIDRARLAMEAGGRGNATVTDPLGYINAVDPNVDQVFASFVNPNSGNSPAVSGHLQTDDVGIVWLQDQSRANVAGVVAQLEDPAHRAAMFADALPAGTIFTTSVVAGDELVDLFGDPTSGDPIAAARAPNVFIQPNAGVIYSGSSKKIAEHGGGTSDDTNVALLVSNPGLRGRIVDRRVTTTQVAPTILRALDLDPDLLDAVRREGTRPLPGLRLE